MGLGGSKLAGTSVTRNELLKATQSSRDFMNTLFQAMITKLTPEDFLKLSKTASCSTFVFVMADAIGTLFQDLRIRPKIGKDSGIVLFQKADKLREQTPETRRLCLTIAYFYVRIFQIFGALSMSILDDPGAGGTLGLLAYRPPVAQAPGGLFGRAPVRVPGAVGAMLGGGMDDDLLDEYYANQSGGQNGGAEARYFLSATSRQFNPIRNLLSDPVQLRIGRETAKNAFSFLERPEISLLPDRSGQNVYYSADGNAYLLANMKLSGAVRSTVDATFKMTMTLTNFRYVDPLMDATTLAQLNTYLAKETFTTKFNSLDSTTWDSEKGVSFTETLHTELDQILRLKDDPEKAKARAARRVPGLPGAPAVGVPGAHQLDPGVPRELENQYIIQTLKSMVGYRSVSYCVARALQLLDANTLYSVKPVGEATSGICMPRFDVLIPSVPEAGKSVKSVPGLRALDQLYSTNPHVVSDKTVFDRVEPEYAEFISKLSGLFGRSVAPGAVKLSGMDAVIAKDPNCGPAAVKHILKLQDPKGIQAVLAIVKQLFGRQLGHTKKVMAFFSSRLFVLRKVRDPGTGTLRDWADIHPRILQGGISELEQVSKEARQLLVEYYTGCEELYQKGVQEILSKTRFIPV